MPDSGREQTISLSAPPLAELPHWGTRVEFRHFFVELVPECDRIFNVRLPDTFASISFGPAEGTSSLAGDRLRRYDRRPYEYIIAPPRFPLRGETRNAPEVLALVIDVDGMRGLLADALASPPESIRPEVVIGAPAAFTSVLAKRIRVQLSRERVAHAYLESLCLTLLVEMFRSVAERPTRADRAAQLDRRAVGMLTGYIDTNLDGDLSIEALASLVGVSPDRLGRDFKQQVGDSPHSYVIQRRADAARRLLQSEGELPLSQIALAAGFSSQSHMTTTFKKLLGITPGALRRRERSPSDS